MMHNVQCTMHNAQFRPSIGTAQSAGGYVFGWEERGMFRFLYTLIFFFYKEAALMPRGHLLSAIRQKVGKERTRGGLSPAPLWTPPGQETNVAFERPMFTECFALESIEVDHCHSAGRLLAFC